MKIYVINMKNDKDRRNSFDQTNSNYIDYEYFEAIDGNSEKFNIKDILKPNTIGYKNGDIGCAMSHLCLWNKCIEINEPIIIMEDDVFVSKYFKIHLNSVLDMLPYNWHILQLNYNCDSILGYSNTSYENAYTFLQRKNLMIKISMIFKTQKYIQQLQS